MGKFPFVFLVYLLVVTTLARDCRKVDKGCREKCDKVKANSTFRKSKYDKIPGGYTSCLKKCSKTKGCTYQKRLVNCPKITKDCRGSCSSRFKINANLWTNCFRTCSKEKGCKPHRRLANCKKADKICQNYCKFELGYTKITFKNRCYQKCFIERGCVIHGKY